MTTAEGMMFVFVNCQMDLRALKREIIMKCYTATPEESYFKFVFEDTSSLVPKQ